MKCQPGYAYIKVWMIMNHSQLIIYILIGYLNMSPQHLNKPCRVIKNWEANFFLVIPRSPWEQVDF